MDVKGYGDDVKGCSVDVMQVAGLEQRLERSEGEREAARELSRQFKLSGEEMVEQVDAPSPHVIGSRSR